MPKINDTSAYPITAPAAGDFVPGTDVSDTSPDPAGQTVSFSVDGLADHGAGRNVRAGLAADRPAAAVAGRLYYATDTDTLSRDTGAAWETLAIGWSTITGTPSTLAGYGITDAASDAELAAHEADTTSVHGIADTATLYRAGGADVAVADGGTGASDAPGARTNLGLGTAATADTGTTGGQVLTRTGADGLYQPLDADLSAVAALTTTAYGRALLEVASAAALRAAAELGALAVEDDVTAAQISDATANGRALITAANYAAMRALLDLEVGTDVQAQDAELSALAGLTSAADRLPYFTGSGSAALATFTGAGRDLVDDADAAAQRTTLGLGTIATQAASNVSITGGAISGITDLAVADGGTGASTAPDARANLGTNDAANLTTGTVATARLGSGAASSSTFLRGDQTWAAAGAIVRGRVNIAGTNYYHMPGVGALTQLTTQTLTTNQIRYEPRLVTTAITLDRIAIEVTTGSGSGTTARLGIYTADTDWNPVTLVLDAGTVPVDTGAAGTQAITINQALDPGRYLFCLNADAGAILRNIRANAPWDAMHPGANPSIVALLANQTYGALPGTPTAIATVSLGATTFNNCIFVRISAP